MLPCYSEEDWMDGLYDTLLCRLSALPAPSTLQHFSGLHHFRTEPRSSVGDRAATLLSAFSLPHLSQLQLGGFVRRTELFAFISSFICAPALLTSLVIPEVESEHDDGGRDVQAVQEDEMAVRHAARLLLSRFTALRRLCCGAEMASGAAALPGSMPGDAASGCSGSLYSLTVREAQRPSRFVFTAPLSFPLLTELDVTPP